MTARKETRCFVSSHTTFTSQTPSLKKPLVKGATPASEAFWVEVVVDVLLERRVFWTADCGCTTSSVVTTAEVPALFAGA